jgi:hypothetical protein
MTNLSRREVRAAAEKHRPRRWGRWIGITALVLVVVGIVLAVLGWLLAERVFAARDSLTEAVPRAQEIPALVLSGDVEGATRTTQEVHDAAADAVQQSEFWLWSLGEKVPVLGPNLSAVRVMSQSVADLTEVGADVISAVDLNAFRPVDGAVDLPKLTTAGEAVGAIAAVAADIDGDLEKLPADDLMPQLTGPLATLKAAVGQITEFAGPLQQVAKALPAILGADSPRTYVLMFQGNSEVRASGGNPAALAIVRASEGRIELVEQADSYSFKNDRATSVVPLDPEVEAIYGDTVGRWIPDMTYMPDFPTTVDILKGWWGTVDLPAFDGVLSIDPVALSYLLDATGPIVLDTGETLTRENTVQLLLHDAYSVYEEGRTPLTPDDFFAAAAASVFTSLMTQVDDPLAMMKGLQQATNEGRIKFWSSVPEERDLVAGTKLSGVLPTTNATTTTAGVFFNDTTGSKMDFFMRAEIDATSDQCVVEGAPTFDVTVRLVNDAVREQALGLPRYVTGPNYMPGDVATDVLVYAPPGATIESWNVEGAATVVVKTEGQHLGRHVIRLGVVTTPQTTATITATMSGDPDVAASEYGAFDVWTTPMVSATPIAVTAEGCAVD